MRYLKKFNEELKPQTYLDAAHKLKQIVRKDPKLAKSLNAEERMKNLINYAQEKKWEKLVEYYSKWGEFTITLEENGVSLTKKFYLAVVEMCQDIIEFFEPGKDNTDITFPFAIGLIPVNKEDIMTISDSFDIDFDNGFFWGFFVNIEYEIKNSVPEYKGVTLFKYGDVQVSFDRRTANGLKSLISSLLDPKSDYKSDDTRYQTIYDYIEIEIIQGLEIGVDFGLDMGRIKQDLDKTPTSQFIHVS